jgi:soluble lytic murein transglycosylase-like protein
MRAGSVARVAALGALLLAPAPAAHADHQQDPALRAVLEQAIAETRCDGHDDRYGGEVFFKLHEPQLRRIVADSAERIDILRSVYCEAGRVAARYRDRQGIELRLTPELVLAVIDVESHFNRYAVSAAGAVGLMQVMPFWPRRLGVDNRLFGSVDFNVRMGCEILAYYLQAERNDYRRALARYNGSSGRREYPDRVLARLADRWRG